MRNLHDIRETPETASGLSPKTEYPVTVELEKFIEYSHTKQPVPGQRRLIMNDHSVDSFLRLLLVCHNEGQHGPTCRLSANKSANAAQLGLLRLLGAGYYLTQRRKSAGGLAAVTPLHPPNPEELSVFLRANIVIVTRACACAEFFTALTQSIRSLNPLLPVRPRPPPA